MERRLQQDGNGLAMAIPQPGRTRRRARAVEHDMHPWRSAAEHDRHAWHVCPGVFPDPAYPGYADERT
jgi:hypothetical protein